MRIAVLCGGYGTRLQGVSNDLPKPMIPIGGKPILWHILRGFSSSGFRSFVLCLGYRSDVVKQYFLNLPAMLEDVTLDRSNHKEPLVHARAPEFDWEITMAETGLDSKTGHRVRRAGIHIPDEDDIFGVTYGDGVTDLDFRNVVEFHRSHGKLATVTAVRPPGRFGELGFEPDGSVTEFNEKPQAQAGWISGGFFVFSREVLDRLDSDPDLVLEEEPLRSLARENELMAYQHEGFWYCVDTPRDYRQMQQMWAADKAPWAVWD